MPAPENNLKKLAVNAVPDWYTHVSTPGAGNLNLGTLLPESTHGLEGVLQADIRSATAFTYKSANGDSIAALAGEWVFIPLHNGLSKIELDPGAGALTVILWGAAHGN